MPDNISPEQYHSQVAALNHEIYRLNVRLNEAERRRALEEVHDPLDPFGNPTEYHESQADYSEILPQINYPGFTVPLDPQFEERKRLKRCYAAAGGCMLAHFVLSDYVTAGIYAIIRELLRLVSPDASSEAITRYIARSAILPALMLLIYGSFNVIFALLGMKLNSVKPSVLFRTKDYSPGKAGQYCLIGIFLLFVTTLVSVMTESIFSKYGYTTDVVDLDGVGITASGKMLMLIYTCIVAPVTEEFFFRGMLLHGFSKANQRFAVFFSALFFGLAHANIPQFLLAFTLGIFLAHITLIHGSLVPSIIVHIFINSFSTTMSELDLEGSSLIIANEIFIVLAVIGGILLMIFRSSHKIPATTPAQTRRGLSLALATPLVTITLILQIIYLFSLIFNSAALNSISQFL